ARLAWNVDGEGWERGRGGWLERKCFKFEWRDGGKCVHTPIDDSRTIQTIYERMFSIKATFIPYGVSTYSSDEDDKLEQLGIRKGTYALIVGRLIPENNADLLIDGFQSGVPDGSLLVVGGSNYRSEFHHRLE